jgi:hypothetical protein
MLSERLQILVDPEQRRRLEVEAQRRGTSVGSLIREAVDAHFSVPTRAERLRALEGILEFEGRFVDPAELNRIVERERDEQLDRMLRGDGR